MRSALEDEQGPRPGIASSLRVSAARCRASRKSPRTVNADSLLHAPPGAASLSSDRPLSRPIRRHCVHVRTAAKRRRRARCKAHQVPARDDPARWQTNAVAASVNRPSQSAPCDDAALDCPNAPASRADRPQDPPTQAYAASSRLPASMRR